MANTPAEVVSRPWYDFSLGQGFTVGSGGNHDGRDVQTPLHTPLTNLIGGTVTPHTGWYPWGGEVDIQLPNGITETWAHLDAIAVKPGQIVQPGQFIGLSGGDNLLSKYSTGPHTHFSLFSGAPWNNAEAINPTPLLDWAQEFMGSGPSSTAGDPISGVVTSPSATTSATKAALNIPLLSQVATSFNRSSVPDLAWSTGLIIMGGLLLLAGLVVFILPGRDKAMQAAGVVARTA